MATTVTSTIKSAGGHYTTITAWEAAKQGGLVAADQIQEAECYDFEDTAHDFVIDGSTTDATRYMRIYTPLAERHNGTAGTGFRLIADGGAVSMAQLSDDYVRLEGIEFNCNNNSSTIAAVRVHVSTGCRVSHCLVYNMSGANCRGISAANGDAVTCYFYNNIIYDGSVSGFGGGMYCDIGTGTVYMYNNTVCDFNPGSYNIVGGTAIAKNCISQGSSGGFTGTFSGSSTKNLSELAADAPGTSGINSTAVTFTNEAGNDFTLSSSDTAAKDAGVDLSADAGLAFSDDILGQTRSGTWDIGASEVVTSVVDPITTSTTDSLAGGEFI